MTGTHPEPIGDSSHGTDDRRPPDLGALRRSDELFDALSERRDVSSDDADDPAFALLKALVDDVDAGAPPLSRPAREDRGRRASRRRVPRTLVSLCVATTVLMTTGVAAAGGALSPFAPTPGGSEPHIRSRPDLPESRGAATGGVSGSPTAVPTELKRRQVVFPRGGEAAGTYGDQQPDPRPTKPVTVSPSPEPTPYDLYAGTPDSPDPAPGTSGSPAPLVDPSGSPEQSPGQGQGEDRPGQPASGQGAVP
ncbi:hypothetical protein ACRYCC_01450 [Actinomadura scrupuli]|uniref:hypothetical protein n=1 Tax=Actinomadura scrupuli TaxID=559629 RepID=UPI003D9908D1